MSNRRLPRCDTNHLLDRVWPFGQQVFTTGGLNRSEDNVQLFFEASLWGFYLGYCHVQLRFSYERAAVFQNESNLTAAIARTADHHQARIQNPGNSAHFHQYRRFRHFGMRSTSPGHTMCRALALSSKDAHRMDTAEMIAFDLK